MNRIMIVEDDTRCIKHLKQIIDTDESQIISITKESAEAIKFYKMLKPNIVLIDIVLHGKESGIDIAEKLKAINPALKIIFLTEYSSKELIDLVVDLKAYGYMIKPINPHEIIATIKLSLLHKDIEELSNIDEVVKLKEGYLFNIKSSILSYNEEEIPISKQQKKLLKLLSKNLNYTVSYEQISYYIWGEKKTIATIRTLIYRLRQKLKVNIIRNTSSYGYSLQGA